MTEQKGRGGGTKFRGGEEQKGRGGGTKRLYPFCSRGKKIQGSRFRSENNITKRKTYRDERKTTDRNGLATCAKPVRWNSTSCAAQSRGAECEGWALLCKRWLSRASVRSHTPRNQQDAEDASQRWHGESAAQEGS